MSAPSVAAERGGFVVWLRGLRGPEIQKWTPMMFAARGRPGEFLAAHAVSAEIYALPFSDLERLFPPPVTEAAP
jgi:hypothetical protein